MAVEPRTERDELDVLRARLDALEREQVERTARAHHAVAAAQVKTYWLDRWQLDLNSLMRTRLARELRVAIRGAQAGLGSLGQWRALRARLIGAPAKPAAASAPAGDANTRALSPDLLRSAPVSELLYERLSAGDLAAVDARLEAAERELRDSAEAADRMRVTLALAAHHGIDGALERTGLSAAMPGPEVPAMARGALAAGGSFYYADLVADALGATGFELQRGQAGLDFGCSSGRIVRVLAAAHPDLEWHGCDPNPAAVGWASTHLPGIRFEHSQESPRLPFGDETFDFAYAISIWSHFAEDAALDWLDDLRRVLRPRGRLLLTTHGEQSLAHAQRVGRRSPEQLADIRRALGERGFWFTPEYEGIGDHGIANPDWGISFLTAEWLLAKATPKWRVALFHPGRVEADQDLYVLERR